jgi:hypothetical protein
MVGQDRVTPRAAVRPGLRRLDVAVEVVALRVGAERGERGARQRGERRRRGGPAARQRGQPAREEGVGGGVDGVSLRAAVT